MGDALSVPFIVSCLSIIWADIGPINVIFPLVAIFPNSGFHPEILTCLYLFTPLELKLVKQASVNN